MALLLVVSGSFALALLGVWVAFGVPTSLIVAAAPFVILIPAAGAAVVAWVLPRLAEPADRPAADPPEPR